MPRSRTSVAMAKAAAKEWVAETMYPVMMGAEMADNWPQKFARAPTVPTLPCGAIREGTVQATGAAAARPPNAMLIHTRAVAGECAWAAPQIARPRLVPISITAWRTRVLFQPRWMRKSTSQPPTTKSLMAAKSQGTLV